MPKRKAQSSTRNDLTLKEKVAKLDAHAELKGELSQRDAAEKLAISRGCLQNLLKNEDKIRQDATVKQSDNRRFRTGKDAAVEAALYEWFKFSKSRNVPVNGRILMQKAESLAREAEHGDFKATDGWFTRWKKRHGVVFTILKDEAADTDVPAAENFLVNVWPALKQQFNPKDIFNADETGAYFRALPDSTYVDKKDKKTVKGFKTAKDRVTVLVTCNMEGENEELLLIGKSKQPRCFKGVKKLPFAYENSKNAWMNGAIWERYLRNLDLKMGRKGRKVLLLVDNCSAHKEVEGLKNVTLRFLPPNTTAHLQPCDQGIIRTLKAYFRHELRQKLIDAIDNAPEEEILANDLVKKVSILEAMEMLDSAWKKVKRETIVNCWKKGGFLGREPLNEDVEPEEIPLPPPPPGLSEEEFQHWIDIDEGIEITDEATEKEVTAQLVESIKAKDQPEYEAEAEEDDDEDEEPTHLYLF
ncbi:Uncharacterised protein r2_g3468 [Pycnogonum litorale]